MKTTKRYLIIILAFTLSTATFAQKVGKTEVIGYTKNQEAPLPFVKVKKDGTTIYDPRVFGSPKFFPGHIVTVTGEKVAGKIAVFNNSSDWNFVKRALLIIPEGEDKAQYLSVGSVIYGELQRKKEVHHYDYYDGVLLRRLVSGKLRLSYNPAANTSRKVSEFVSKSFLDSVSNKMIRNSIEKDLKNGKSIEEVVGKAKLKNDAMNAFSEIEITEKEYLLYDSVAQKTIAITKENYSSEIDRFLKECSSLSEKEIKKYRKNYKNIEEVINALNTSCN